MPNNERLIIARDKARETLLTALQQLREKVVAEPAGQLWPRSITSASGVARASRRSVEIKDMSS